MTWTFFNLISNAYWNKFWCYTGICVGFKESKGKLSCFILQNLKITFKNSIFWCWIWAIIHPNHLYNLELIEFQAYSTPTRISMLLSNLRWFFQKISITYHLGQNCWDKIENLFSVKKTLFCIINVVGKVWGFWQQNLVRFNIDIGGLWGEFGIGKIESFLEFTWFSIFVSTIFVQSCGKFLKHKR